MKTDWKKGSGEYVAFMWIAPMLCFLIIVLCSYIKLSSDLHDILNALDVAGRSASVCQSKDDAEQQAFLVAQSSIINSDIKNLDVKIDYVTSDTEWNAGVIFKVTVSAEVDSFLFSFQPFTSTKQTKRIEKSMIYTVEGASYSASDLIYMAVTMYGEAGVDYNGCIAVGTTVMNRIDSAYYPNTVYEVVSAPYQYEGFGFHLDMISRPETIPQNCLDAAKSVLSGTRTDILMSNPFGYGNNRGPCMSFFTAMEPYISENQPGLEIGGNWFHWKW